MSGRYPDVALLDIVTFPDSFLKNKTDQVTNIDATTQALVDDMSETMYQAPGVGLAAIQVGINQSLLVFDVAPQDENRQLQVLINPTIVTQEGEILSEGEGCLSVPEYRADVMRARRILVEAVDRDGNPLRFEAEGFPAVVIQHEIDHLNGTLFIDHISSLKRQMYVRRIKKRLKNQ
ncbi:MAG: peptide deformylase [Desulfobacteraceae bacterium]|nr:peptide deformylase [Desulfobacteraceae bacterium]